MALQKEEAEASTLNCEAGVTNIQTKESGEMDKTHKYFICNQVKHNNNN